VVSKTLTSVGPNATLIDGDLEAAVRHLKAAHEGTIEVGGPVLARRLTELGLIDEYRIYLHPVVLGSGDPFFAAPAAAAAQELRADGRRRDAADLRAGLRSE
jgi:dihydrofolate reductase